MSSETKISSTIPSSSYHPPLQNLSEKSEVETLILQLFTHRACSPSNVKFLERPKLHSRAAQMDMTLLPPPKAKNLHPNWFEVAINPRPDQSLSSPEVAISPGQASTSSPEIAISPQQDQLAPSFNEASLQDAAEWLQELDTQAKNSDPYANINFEGAWTVRIEERGQDFDFDSEGKYFPIFKNGDSSNEIEGLNNQDDSIKTPSNHLLPQRF